MGEGIQWSPYLGEMKEEINQLPIREIKEWNGHDLTPAREFRTSQGYGGFMAYGTEKVEKIGIGDCVINGVVHYGLCTIFPSEDYDLPIFVSTWEERENEITFLVDLMPTVDSLIDEEYRKRYFDSIQRLWERYSNLPGICPEEDDVIRSLCSIVYNAARVPLDREGMRLAALAPHTEYLKAYLGFLKDVSPVADDTKRKELKRKREAIRQTLRAHYEELLKGPTGKALGKDISELMIHMFF
jgi:hypothetical protein